MKIKAWFAQFFAKENLTEKAQKGDFSPEEIEKINAACKTQFNTDFAATLVKMNEEEAQITALGEDHKAILATIFAPNVTAAATAAANVVEPKAAQAATVVAQQHQTIAAQQATIEALANTPEPSKPARTVGKLNVVPVTGGAHTKTHVWGIEHDLFAANKPWNVVTATRQPLDVVAANHGVSADWDDHRDAFKAELVAYGKSLSGRMGQLQAENRLHTIKAQDIDFSGFDNTGWGNEYVVRRQDALIAYIRKNNNISGLFSVRYGVQNKEVLTNAFLTHFSASFQSGRYFKGASVVQPMEAQVFDLMIKHKFENLKQLEKEYIGYLNREGSDPIKFTWIEWMLARILEVAQNEWNERRILGVRIEPTAGTLGHHLHGSDGLFRQLRKYSDDLRLLPFTGYTYTSSTILTSVENFLAAIYAKLPSIKGLRLHINEKHLPWYKAAFRAAYGTQFDFTGAKLSVMNYEDVELVGVPNMGTKTCMFLTAPGNIELYENVAGEMAKIGTQRDLEELMVFSYWKEGVGAYMVGKKHADAAALAADNYQNQYIFFTDDTIALAAGATTADATKGDWFKTINNAGATAITDITSAVDGLVYRIICGGVTNATTVAKASLFSNLTATWTPTALGDYLEVYWNAATSKFVEVGRQVTA